MDIISLLLFFIYTIFLLFVLVFVSPLISAVIMILIPIFSILLLPDYTMQFFSIEQFSFLEGTVPIYNIHILLLIWSALIGVIAYAEVLSWYLLREKKPEKLKQETEVSEENGKKIKLRGVNFKEFLDTIWKTLKGEK